MILYEPDVTAVERRERRSGGTGGIRRSRRTRIPLEAVDALFFGMGTRGTRKDTGTAAGDSRETRRRFTGEVERRVLERARDRRCRLARRAGVHHSARRCAVRFETDFHGVVCARNDERVPSLQISRRIPRSDADPHARGVRDTSRPPRLGRVSVSGRAGRPMDRPLSIGAVVRGCCVSAIRGPEGVREPGGFQGTSLAVSARQFQLQRRAWHVRTKGVRALGR